MSRARKQGDNISMEPPEEPEAYSGQQREAAIRQNVLLALGRPPELFHVAVVPLWGNHFRVNIVTGENAGSVLIPNSYFVTADDHGKIVKSTPSIEKRY